MWQIFTDFYLSLPLTSLFDLQITTYLAICKKVCKIICDFNIFFYQMFTIATTLS